MQTLGVYGEKAGFLEGLLGRLGWLSSGRRREVAHAFSFGKDDRNLHYPFETRRQFDSWLMPLQYLVREGLTQSRSSLSSSCLLVSQTSVTETVVNSIITNTV